MNKGKDITKLFQALTSNGCNRVLAEKPIKVEVKRVKSAPAVLRVIRLYQRC